MSARRALSSPQRPQGATISFQIIVTVVLSNWTPLTGIPSTVIHAHMDTVEGDVHHLHSVRLLRHGHVVAVGWGATLWPALPS